MPPHSHTLKNVKREGWSKAQESVASDRIRPDPTRLRVRGTGIRGAHTKGAEAPDVVGSAQEEAVVDVGCAWVEEEAATGGEAQVSVPERQRP